MQEERMLRPWEAERQRVRWAARVPMHKVRPILGRRESQNEGSSMKVIEGLFGRQACTNLAADLRELAEAVDRGEIVDLVAAYVRQDEHETLCAASLSQSIFLATLLQRRAIDNCMGG